MADLKVTGPTPLTGSITPSGNKNAILPILCASLLTEHPITIQNVPEITDVIKIVELMQQIGSQIDWDKTNRVLKIQNQNLSLDRFDGNLPLGMRASLLLIPPLLYRFKQLTIDTNIGGCTLGMREIDPHIELLQQMGAQIERHISRTLLTLPQETYTGASLWPHYASVTATENTIMAASLAQGQTILYNAAAEPHVQDLCQVLTRMGADIKGIGSNRLEIHGVTELKSAKVQVSSDHHEITTFLALAAMTNGRIQVNNAIPAHFPLITHEFRKLGVRVEYQKDTAVVETNQSFIPEKPFTANYIPRIEAAPWPYFPVDLLPLMVALSLKTKGPTRFWNKVYEGGLFWTTELTKFGATIEIEDPHRILVLGPTDLHAAEIECPYIIRATVALVMTAMAAQGTSLLRNIDTIHRAHPNFIANLQSLGAQIEEV